MRQFVTVLLIGGSAGVPSACSSLTVKVIQSSCPEPDGRTEAIARRARGRVVAALVGRLCLDQPRRREVMANRLRERLRFSLPFRERSFQFAVSEVLTSGAEFGAERIVLAPGTYYLIEYVSAVLVVPVGAAGH
jgi:hypothetical protein